ncbi:hypothetical protein [Hamadaea tsunoensis]|uniref:hypothetical protein n=1 Tax=Hamadaea tsunoensis TaxID=53368 RepID=UPI00040758F7|nr:hypothetical protein [Hamadaea tsunoensis]
MALGWRRPGRAWAAHPATLLALGLLILNDHVLKARFPGPVTGKLSDVAGLIVAPALLAAVFRLAAGPSVLVVGTLFTIVKISGYAAGTVAAVWSAFAGPAVIVADPTDLLALPALVYAYSLGRRANRGPDLRVALVLPVAVLGLLASARADVPEATQVGVVGGEIVGQIGPVTTVATADGVHWREVPEEELSRVWLSQDWSVHRAVESAAEPGRRYRPDAGLGVQESLGGGEWRTIWHVTDGRRDFLARAYATSPDQVVTADVAVMGVGAGRVVVAADGRDGFAVAIGDGPFHRVGFPPTARFGGRDPAPLSAPGHGIAAELALAALAAWLVLLAGVQYATEGDVPGHTRGWQMLAGTGLLAVWCGFAGSPLLAPAALLFGATIVVLGLPMLLLTSLADGALPRSRALSVLGAALAGGLLVAAPFVGWSAGFPDTLGSAYLAAVLSGLTGLVGGVVAGAYGLPASAPAGWLRPRWIRPVRGADPTPPVRRPGRSTEDPG